jgi:hypothetical protein
LIVSVPHLGGFVRNEFHASLARRRSSLFTA